VFGISVPERERQIHGIENDAGDLEQNDQADLTRWVRYRVHEDGGEIGNDYDDVVSLPPIYDAVARSLPQSNPDGPAPTT